MPHLPHPRPRPSGNATPSGNAAPIVDLRERLTPVARLPARLGTAALWMGSLWLLGPLKLTGLLLAGCLVTPGVLWLDRGARHGPSPRHALRLLADPSPVAAVACTALTDDPHPPASVCILHHDALGRIVGLEVPAAPWPISVPSPDAHPVG